MSSLDGVRELPEMKEQSILTGAYYGSLDMVQAAFRRGGEANEVDATDGGTPLHYAVMSDAIDVIRYIIRFDGDANIRDKKGMTALHLACRSGDAETVKALLDSKADTGIEDNSGVTPAALAEERTSEAGRAVQELLRAHAEDHAKPNAAGVEESAEKAT
eukprot:gnl/TRDRNA2_/TRDRNA2_180545_c0_seq1.p1 gnl/TRDRNA2_/TRDRNA2_180545_c0~~gnl/TRDRNA2_/TRDRNA2_180545_c0_seq1.p1  ORF type:complete len:160 (+),score=31.07 gnl/TRDRNA2_/TRDRNA2_180545_c0_seq1:76-555(+)